MKVKNLVTRLAGVGLGLALSSGLASAGVTWYSPITAFEDDNLDYVFDNDNSGTISVGDRFVSVLEFVDSQGILAGQGPTGFGADELTAIADVTIIAKSGDNYIFAPTGAGGLLAAYASGTAIAVFLDNSPDLNVINAACGSRATCVAAASDGLPSPYLTFGFFGDPDEFWFATAQNGGDSISTVQGGSASTKYGTVNFALSVGVNNSEIDDFGLQDCGIACNPIAAAGQDDKTQLVGSADILGGQGLTATEWTARSDTDAQLVPLRVPEPASLALIGAALAGLGIARRRAKPA